MKLVNHGRTETPRGGGLDPAASLGQSIATVRPGRHVPSTARSDWIFLDPPQAGRLAELMEQWDMSTRTEVLQNALDIAHKTVAKKTQGHSMKHSYQIEPRSVELGGGWRLQFLENVARTEFGENRTLRRA